MFSVIFNIIKRLHIRKEEGGICDSLNSASQVNGKKPIIDFTCCTIVQNRIIHNTNQGTITFLSDQYGLIDDTLYFDREVLPRRYRVHVGDYVTFTTVNLNGNQTERISSIDTRAFDSDPWTQSNYFEYKNPFTNSFEKIENAQENISHELLCGKLENRRANFTERILCGKISGKEGMDIVIDELGIKFNLRDIYFDFVPFPGKFNFAFILSFESIAELNFLFFLLIIMVIF